MVALIEAAEQWARGAALPAPISAEYLSDGPCCPSRDGTAPAASGRTATAGTPRPGDTPDTPIVEERLDGLRPSNAPAAWFPHQSAAYRAPRATWRRVVPPRFLSARARMT